jgi:hypothetical protein
MRTRKRTVEDQDGNSHKAPYHDRMVVVDRLAPELSGFPGNTDRCSYRSTDNLVSESPLSPPSAIRLESLVVSRTTAMWLGDMYSFRMRIQCLVPVLIENRLHDGRAKLTLCSPFPSLFISH